MKFYFPPPQNAHERAALVDRMAELRRQRDAGEISKRRFKYEYGALVTTLWGPKFFRTQRALARNQVSEGVGNV